MHLNWFCIQPGWAINRAIERFGQICHCAAIRQLSNLWLSFNAPRYSKLCDREALTFTFQLSFCFCIMVTRVNQTWSWTVPTGHHPFCYFQNMLQKWIMWHFNFSAIHLHSPCMVVDGWGRVLCFLKIGQDAINKTNDERNTYWHITKHYMYHSRQKYFEQKVRMQKLSLDVLCNLQSWLYPL